MSPRTVAVGGAGTLIILLVGYFLGVDPQKLNRLVGNAPIGGGGNGQIAERPPTAEEERSRKFAATILGFTELVWAEQFRLAGKAYVAPHMVLFTAEVQTACGNAPSAVGPFYCPADKTVYLESHVF